MRGDRTGFGLASEHATGVDLLLWAPTGTPASADVIALERVAPSLWWAEIQGRCAGLRYAYRVDGPAAATHRFDPRLRLLDPRAPAVSGKPHHEGGAGLHGTIVDVQPDRSPPRTRRTWAETVIYEAHVKGLTKLHPEVPPDLRGTYLGLATEPVLEHLRGLGVTAIELLPVQHHITEARLARLGLTNYWGYSPVGFFAPHAGYATGDDGRQVAEFREMVRKLHAAGLEVIVDLVLNHSGEGAPEEPTLSLRGIDNASYYWLDPEDPARYLDFTGCGNTLAAGHPVVQELVLDCARWWVERLGVDGFRVDLAPALFRDVEGRFDPRAALFAAIAADPVLARVKWIAEPWDLGPEGHCRGRFPGDWVEWNDRYRDVLRRFWRGDAGLAPEAAHCLAGGSDAPRPGLSVHYVTCHDGFTLRDLVSYTYKRNEANAEGNRDGADENWSSGGGVEGPTGDRAVLRRRRQVRESLLATLLLSRGIPMLSHGDELGRTQAGNNNAYCHDGPLVWLDWRVDPGEDFRQLIRGLTEVRRSYLDVPARPASPGGWRELAPPAGIAGPPGLALQLGQRLLVACNPSDSILPVPVELARGRPLLATAQGTAPPAGQLTQLPAHSVLLLERPRA